MEEQFDALLYLGAQASSTRAELSPTPRSDAAHMEMRLGRMVLLGMERDVDGLKQYPALGHEAKVLTGAA